MKYKDIYGDMPEHIAQEIVGEMAVARARYRVQDDFNRELIKEIATKTEHENLAATCFVDVNLESDDSLDVHVYNDWTVIDGLYNSNSSFHQSGGEWKSVVDNYSTSREEFWSNLESMKDEYGDEWRRHRGNYGTVDPEWLADNFWDGVYYTTNGWPRSSAEFLSVYKYHDVSALSVIKSYYNRYLRSNKFQKYIQEEINAMRK